MLVVKLIFFICIFSLCSIIQEFAPFLMLRHSKYDYFFLTKKRQLHITTRLYCAITIGLEPKKMI